jgi:excisionase family DNA binding protein
MFDVVTAPEVARIFGVSEAVVRLWCRQGKLKARKAGRDWLIPQTELEALKTKKAPNPKT